MISKIRPLVSLLAVYVLALVLLVLFQTGCGPSARDKTLSATLTSVNAARDGFLAYDDVRQGEIVDACNPPACTEAEGEAKLNAYIAKREPVVQAFEAAYRTLALGAIDGSTPLPMVVETVTRAIESAQALRSSR